MHFRIQPNEHIHSRSVTGRTKRVQEFSKQALRRHTAICQDHTSSFHSYRIYLKIQPLLQNCEPEPKLTLKKERLTLLGWCPTLSKCEPNANQCKIICLSLQTAWSNSLGVNCPPIHFNGVLTLHVNDANFSVNINIFHRWSSFLHPVSVLISQTQASSHIFLNAYAAAITSSLPLQAHKD